MGGNPTKRRKPKEAVVRGGLVSDYQSEFTRVEVAVRQGYRRNKTDNRYRKKAAVPRFQPPTPLFYALILVKKENKIQNLKSGRKKKK